MRIGQAVRLQRVAGPVGGEYRQAGVGHARQRDGRVAGQMAQVLAHLGGPGRAVQPHQVDAERLKRGHGRADLAAEQHRARGLDRHRRDQRRAGPGLGDGPLHADDGRLGLQQILAGLDDQGVGSAAQQPGRIELVGVPQLGEGDMAECRQLGARSHRAEHPARAACARGLVSGLPGEPGSGLGEFFDPVSYPVLAEIAQVGAERVGGDAVDPGGQVGVMNVRHDVRPGDVQDLVAALVPGEVIELGAAALQHGSHRAIGDDDALAERRAQRGRPSGRGGGLAAGRLLGSRHDDPIVGAAVRWLRTAGPAAGRVAPRMAGRDMVIMVEHVIWTTR